MIYRECQTLKFYSVIHDYNMITLITAIGTR